jgi:uncharacterized oxidoreductase
VIVSGRRQDKLDEAKKIIPGLITIRSDIQTEQGREELFEKVIKDYPETNVLLNNAAVYTSADEVKERSQWLAMKQQLEINLEGTMHLSYLFIPHFLKKPKAVIMGITSAVAFIPVTSALAYSTSKAAVHHFLVGLRYQLKDTSIAVIEALPGPTITDMLPEKLAPQGVTAEAYVADALVQIENGQTEFGLSYGPLTGVNKLDRETLDKVMIQFNS